MEKIFKSVALIQHSPAGQKKMLLRQKTPYSAWQFVVADRHIPQRQFPLGP